MLKRKTLGVFQETRTGCVMLQLEALKNSLGQKSTLIFDERTPRSTCSESAGRFRREMKFVYRGIYRKMKTEPEFEVMDFRV